MQIQEGSITTGIPFLLFTFEFLFNARFIPQAMGRFTENKTQERRFISGKAILNKRNC